MPNSRLEQYRDQFLNQIHRQEFSGERASDFLSYWRAVEAEAKATEDLGRIDGWAKEIARDRDKLAALKAQQQQASSSQMGDSEVVALINQILSLLDAIEGSIKKRHGWIRDELGLWVVLAGMGRKSKPKKNKAEEEQKETQEVVLAKAKKPEPPTKKKMER